MKKLAIFILIVATVACKRDYKTIYTFEDKTNKAKLKFVHALVNAYPLPDTAAQAGLQLYINGNKLTGNNITYGGGVFPNLEYTLVPAGNNTLKAIIPASGAKPEIPVLEAPLTLGDQKTYTAFIADSLPNSSVVLIEEDFSPIADSGKYFVRLVNLVPNANFDLYSTGDQKTVASDVAFKAASKFEQVFVGSGARSFAVRAPGGTTNLASVNITPVQGRMYTLFTYGVLGKGGTRAAKVTFYTSRFQTYEF